MEIKRYRVEGKHGTDTIIDILDVDGEYCLWEDVQAIIEAAQQSRALDEPNVCLSCGTEHHELVSCPGTWVKPAHQ